MENINVKRHSLSHVMAAAVKEIFGPVGLAIGPAIDNGFYYDFDTEKTILDSDLKKIENKMREIIGRKIDFVKSEVEKSVARELFATQPYKLELIDDIEGDTVSVYQMGDFVDLCAGPHVSNTSELKSAGFTLSRVSGAYWRGDSKNKMLQRIYAYAFETKEELTSYLELLEEAKKRDHRKLGPDLDLFILQDSAPGMPYWLPHGLKLFNALLEFWREEHDRRGYNEISSPLINARSLWETSGHWDHYQHNMFTLGVEEGEEPFAVKPMNCPNAMLVYKTKTRSYRDLPLRYSDCDVLHRKEISGTLHGLLRVQMFRQDDSHNFIREDQIGAEVNSILDIADLFYDVFGLSYRPVLSTRPDDYMGDIKLWDKAEAELKKIIKERYGEGNYDVNEGDGAFYGPKIDILMKDALGRVWQTGTIQLDFQLPVKFDLTYDSKQGTKEMPVVLHRVIYGSFERFIGILIEHFAGAFPLWIAPCQVGIVPVGEANFAYAEKIRNRLLDEKIRVEADFSDNGMGKKVNNYRAMKTPFTLVLGGKEEENETVSVKMRGGVQFNDIPLEKFVQKIKELIKIKALNLPESF